MTAAWHVLPGGARLQLWPQKAAFDPEQGLLLVADAHLGKAVSFRRLGVPVPRGTTAEGLARLDALLAATGAAEIVFLGDLLHSARVRDSAALAALQAWRDRHAHLALTLVRGNHDRHAGDPPADLGVQVVDGPLQRGPWSLAHEPADLAPAPLAPPRQAQAQAQTQTQTQAAAQAEAPAPARTGARAPTQPGAPAVPAPAEGYRLAGHVHPGVLLHGPAHDRLRLPCFHFMPTQGVLPAFGGFTGLHLLPRLPLHQVYAVLDGPHAQVCRV